MARNAIDALLGRLSQDGEELELRGGLNFVSPLTLTETEGGYDVDIDVTLDGVETTLIVVSDDQRAGTVVAGATIKAALDAAEPGTVVYLPAGRYDCSDVTTLTVPPGVCFTGPHLGHTRGAFTFNDGMTHVGAQLQRKNTWAGFGDVSVPFIACRKSSRLRNLEFYDPDQQTNAAPDVYGPLISVAPDQHGVEISNIVAYNPYFFLLVGRNGTTTPLALGGITVTNVWAYPLWRGMQFGRLADVSRVTNVQFNNSSYFHGTALKDWVAANAEACIIDGAEGIHFYGCFAFRYQKGVVFRDIDGDAGTFNAVFGSWHGGGLDTCQYPVYVDEPNSLGGAGFAFTDCRLVALSTGAAVHFADTTAKTTAQTRPTVFLDNCSLAGGAGYSVHMGASSYGVLSVCGGNSWGKNTGTTPVFYSESSNATIALSARHLVENGTRPRIGGSGTLLDDGGGKMFDESVFGDGSDGDLIVSAGSTSLTADAHYRNVTISGSAQLVLNECVLRVSGTLDLTAAPANAIITRGGGNGSNASGATGGTRGVSASAGTIGVGGPGSDGATGTTGAGAQATAPTAQAPANGGDGGASGAGGTTGGNAGGASRAGATATSNHFSRTTSPLLRGATLINGGAGGGGGGSGGGDGANAGGGGGGGAVGRHVMAIFARRLARGASTTAGAIWCVGGTGGNGAAGVAGNASGGGGGGGGGGGYVRIVAGELVGTAKAGAVTAAGGAGGNGGAASGTGAAGAGGTGGEGGNVMIGELASGTWTLTTGSAGSAPSGVTGGAGGTCTANL